MRQVDIKNNVVNVIGSVRKGVLVKYKPVIRPEYSIIPSVSLISCVANDTDGETTSFDVTVRLHNILSGLWKFRFVLTLPNRPVHADYFPITYEFEHDASSNEETVELTYSLPFDLPYFVGGSYAAPPENPILFDSYGGIKTQFDFEITAECTSVVKNKYENFGTATGSLYREFTEEIHVVPDPDTNRYKIVKTLHKKGQRFIDMLNSEQGVHLLFGDGGLLKEGVHYNVLRPQNKYEILYPFDCVSITHLVPIGSDESFLFEFCTGTGATGNELIPYDVLLYNLGLTDVEPSADKYPLNGSTDQADIDAFNETYQSSYYYFAKTVVDDAVEANIGGNIIIPLDNNIDITQFADTPNPNQRLAVFRCITSSAGRSSIKMAKITTNPYSFSTDAPLDSTKPFMIISDDLEMNVFGTDVWQSESDVWSETNATVTDGTLTILDGSGNVLPLDFDNPAYIIYNVEEA